MSQPLRRRALVRVMLRFLIELSYFLQFISLDQLLLIWFSYWNSAKRASGDVPCRANKAPPTQRTAVQISAPDPPWGRTEQRSPDFHDRSLSRGQKLS